MRRRINGDYFPYPAVTLSAFMGVREIEQKRLLASSYLSVRPLVDRLSAWNSSASPGTDFHKFDICGPPPQPHGKSVEKFHVSLKSDRNNGRFTRKLMRVYNKVSLDCS